MAGPGGSFAHFVRERLGMSLAAIQAKMSLFPKAEALPALGEALRAGRLGTTSATLIARVADGGTIGAWVERAEARTFQHLREEVEAAGLLARVSGEVGWLAPPDDDTLAEVQRVESAVLAGEVDVQMSVARARSGRVPLRVDVASDVADLWMAVRDLHVRSGDGRSFVATLAGSVIGAWSPEPMDRPFEAVYRRDRYRCQSPTCDRALRALSHRGRTRRDDHGRRARVRGAALDDRRVVTVAGRVLSMTCAERLLRHAETPVDAPTVTVRNNVTIDWTA
ncbi:MAG: hypothetical protein IT385_19045 [Deltaproteobacteria bacterium]|nr:hypothetical protein [Deltaproteobacteria bacterium]